jgi:hypothetical protein
VAAQGTGPVGDNTSGVNKQTGLPDPGTIAVISNLEGTTIVAGTKPNTAGIISTVLMVTTLILGTFVANSGEPTATLTSGATTGAKPAKSSGTSPRVSASSLQNFALLGVTGVALIFFML